MAFKGCGKLDTLAELYEELDNEMKAFITETISSNGPASCLFRLLKGPQNHKIYALLLLIINCIIVPSGDGHLCRPSYVQFIKELNDVNGYAWGAALLSFLYHGMKKYSKGHKKFCDGNTVFFLYHIPKLREELQIDLNQVQPPTLLLFSVVEALRKIGGDHYATYEQKTIFILDNLEDTDMDWHPYTTEMLPAQLHDQIPFRTHLSPLFCFNFVEHHLPHLSAKQFEVLEGLNLDGIEDYLELINFKSNRGKTGPNFLKHYEKEVLIWNRRLFAENCIHGFPPMEPVVAAGEPVVAAGEPVVAAVEPPLDPFVESPVEPAGESPVEPKKTRTRRWVGYVSLVTELGKMHVGLI
ncbi:Aminotransferase-like, plant mobile domain [Sesbania bispinosa]|nr:Aminotransferase-like, plant mobile domain [Sesbania bispinosa]